MILTLKCPDKLGVIAQVSSFLAGEEQNIEDVDQHTTHTGEFFMRVEFMPGVSEYVQERFDKAIAIPLGATHQFHDEAPARVAIMASREAHCLLDLINRFDLGELNGTVDMVISNHADHAHRVSVPYHTTPVTPEIKDQAEREQLALLEGMDLIILARYMQILSPGFLKEAPCPIINIHHSFLPAFAGRDPYLRAWKRGVKLIGATAHYVTEELDEGPIICQRVSDVTHKDEVEDMKRIGRDLERVTLAEAVRLHLEKRVLISHDKTVVFK